MEKRMSGHQIITWLNHEAILTLEEDFPTDGNLFTAGLDSMAVMQLVVAAEESFQIILTPADLTRENLSTPNSLANLITTKNQKT